MNTGSMALLRIKSTFLLTEEFVCSRLAESPHTFTNRGLAFVCGSLGRILSPGKGILWGWFFILKECSYLFIAEVADLGWILWISRLNCCVVAHMMELRL